MTRPELDATPPLVRMAYAGAISLLADVAVNLRGPEADENRESIEQALDDWCELTGWTYSRTLNRFDLFPPE